MSDILMQEDLLKPKRKDIIKEENIQFHALENKDNFEEEDEDDLGGDDIFKKKFVNALVRFEDEEDV